jgi:hypothetical protein
MFSYLAIFAVSMAGYAGMSPLAIGIGALALLALSLSEQHALLQRGRAVGSLSDMRETVFGVAVAGTIVTTAAYAAGLLMRFTATT